MDDYSIDRAAENIYNSKTKEYFSEVLSSYSIGNYRSAIVMLYSVIIADLFYKLKELSDRDEDEKAADILTYIREQVAERDRVNKSEWETKVVERVFNETQLLEQSAKAHIEYIKHLRHLSAHPVLDSDDLLAIPNKDTVRAAMHNSLEFVLTRPAMYNNKIAEEFMEKIPSYSSLIFRSESYETFLKNRYFIFFTDKLARRVFYFLWIAVYKGGDQQAIEYREEYYDTLEILYKNYKSILDSYFIEQKAMFNSRINMEEREQLKFLIEFFQHAPHLFNHVSNDNKVVISHKLDTTRNLSLFTKAWFITGSKKEHLRKVFIKYQVQTKSPESNLMDFLQTMSKEIGEEEEFFSFCVSILNKNVSTRSYFGNLQKWKSYIRPYIEDFSEKLIIGLLNIINQNYTLYNAHWLINEYLSDIKMYLDSRSIIIENWNEKFKNLPLYDELCSQLEQNQDE